jgi:adenine deaminase
MTINAADRLRLYRSGAVSPGRRADLLLLSSLEQVSVEQVFVAGKLAAKQGRLVSPLPVKKFPAAAYSTMKIRPLSAADFAIPCEGIAQGVTAAIVNAVEQDGKTSRTKLVQKRCRVEKGELVQGELGKMAVFERHTGKAGRSIGLLANLDEFRGAMATTYAHDCHNLVVYSSNDGDAVLAANRVIEMGGGVAAVLEGSILCEDHLDALAKKFDALLDAAGKMKLNHSEPLTFLTLMALAVSPEIKITDRGLLDVIHKRFIPVIEAYTGDDA